MVTPISFAQVNARLPDDASLFASPLSAQARQGAFCVVGRCYLPTTRTTKVPGKMGARGFGVVSDGAGLSPNCAAARNTRCDDVSKAKVRAPSCVLRFCTCLLYTSP